MRRRPLLRAAAVGGGAYMMGKRAATRAEAQAQQEAGQDQRISNLEQSQGQQPVAGGQPEGGGAAVADQLQRIAALHEQGVLNDQEFAAAKAKLLGV